MIFVLRLRFESVPINKRNEFILLEETWLPSRINNNCHKTPHRNKKTFRLSMKINQTQTPKNVLCDLNSTDQTL